MAVDKDLSDASPYFIYADHAGERNVWPRGRLTTVRFRNSHLADALTSYATAALFLAGMAYII